MTQTLERRFVNRPVELRAAPEGVDSPGVIVGYATTFNSLSRDLGGWQEVIDPAAFGTPGDDLATGGVVFENRVLCRTNHDSNLLLGTTDAGTLTLTVDDVGLLYEDVLPNTSYGRDLAVSVGRGDYCYSSFAFYPLPDGDMWQYGPNEELVRRVTSAQLVDVAPVADPAYWGSSVGLRDFDLDAVRASLQPPISPPGEFERTAVARLRSNPHAATAADRRRR